MSELGGRDGRDEGGTTERFAAGEGTAATFRLTPRFTKFLLVVFSIGLVGISVFQSTDNYYAHRRQDRQGMIIKKLVDQTDADSDRLKSDDEFFAAVRQLIILGPNADAAQRQAIIDELKKQDAERDARNTAASTTTTTVKPGKASGGTTIPPNSRAPSTAPPSSTTTTTMPPSSSPSSISVPPSSLPLPSVCIGTICVTVSLHQNQRTSSWWKGVLKSFLSL